MALRRGRDEIQGQERSLRSLRELRESCGIGQTQLASELGTTQAAVLKLENSTDPRVSSLRRYVEALAQINGAPHDFRLVVTIDEEDTDLRLPSPADRPLETPGTESAGETITVMPKRRQGGRWRLRAWDNDMLEREWVQRNVIAISRDEIGDLTSWPGDDVVLQRLSEALPDRSQQALGTFLTYWRYFRLEMQRDDLVLVPMSGRRVGLARVERDYDYDRDEPSEYLRHVRQVRWLRFLSRDELDEPLRRLVNAPGTICRSASAFPEEWLEL